VPDTEGVGPGVFGVAVETPDVGLGIALGVGVDDAVVTSSTPTPVHPDASPTTTPQAAMIQDRCRARPFLLASDRSLDSARPLLIAMTVGTS